MLDKEMDTKLINKLVNYRDLILVLTEKDIKVRYKSSVLGFMWSVGNPLATALVFYLAFKMVMRIQIEAYPLFLITGLFPWQWFANSINASSYVLLANASIIKKVRFPRNILPLTSVLQDMLHFAMSIPVIIAMLLVYDRTPSWSWLWGIPLLLVIQAVAMYGISLAISSVNLFFRDMERLTGIMVSLLFYCTPVIYSESMVPERYQWVMRLNPMATLIVSWRNLLLDGTMDAGYVAASLAYSLAFLWVGHAIYSKLEWRFAEIL
jgi:lipopolysaccharide transport system permease protein